MTHCPHCHHCLTVDGTTILDVYELEMVNDETDETTRPILVLVVKTDRATPLKEPTTEP